MFCVEFEGRRHPVSGQFEGYDLPPRLSLKRGKGSSTSGTNVVERVLNRLFHLVGQCIIPSGFCERLTLQTDSLKGREGLVFPFGAEGR